MSDIWIPLAVLLGALFRWVAVRVQHLSEERKGGRVVQFLEQVRRALAYEEPKS